MGQVVRITSAWPGGSRNRNGRIKLSFKDGAAPLAKFDTEQVQYTVTPGEDTYREQIELSKCKLEDRKFVWRWKRTAGQNHIIRIFLTADSPQIGVNDLEVEYSDVNLHFYVENGTLESIEAGEAGVEKQPRV